MGRAGIMAMAAASAFVLAACKGESNDIEIAVYQTVESCAAAGKYSDRLCQHFYSTALELHDTASPDYPSRAECEGAEGVGSCEKLVETRHERRHRPALVAFMIPKMQNAASQPIYRSFDTKFTYRTATNIAFTPNADGTARVPRAVTTLPTAATAVRAGFGGVVSAAPAGGPAGAPAGAAKTAAGKAPASR